MFRKRSIFPPNTDTMKTHTSTHRRGFTLIELLIVITIIAILSAISMGGYGYVTRKQADSQAAIHISLLSNALEEYKLDNGAYPPTGNTNSLYTLLYWNGASTTPPGKIYLADLDPNSKKQGWIDGTGAAARILDPWGNEYIYRRGDDPSAKNPDFDLLSKGKDGLTGTAASTADDIDNF
jgi:general secretion pathway protein G